MVFYEGYLRFFNLAESALFKIKGDFYNLEYYDMQDVLYKKISQFSELNYGLDFPASTTEDIYRDKCFPSHCRTVIIEAT
jgi:hypothetical protein